MTKSQKVRTVIYTAAVVLGPVGVAAWAFWSANVAYAISGLAFSLVGLDGLKDIRLSRLENQVKGLSTLNSEEIAKALLKEYKKT